MQESDYQKKLIIALRTKGFFVKHVENIHDPGHPDIRIDGPDNKTMLIECKVANTEQSALKSLLKKTQLPWCYEYLKTTNNNNLLLVVFIEIFDRVDRGIFLFNITDRFITCLLYNSLRAHNGLPVSMRTLVNDICVSMGVQP